MTGWTGEWTVLESRGLWDAPEPDEDEPGFFDGFFDWGNGKAKDAVHGWRTNPPGQ